MPPSPIVKRVKLEPWHKWAIASAGLLALIIPHALVLLKIYNVYDLLTHTSFYIIAGLYFATGAALIRQWKGEHKLKTFVLAQKWPLFGIALATLAIFAVVGCDFRVLSDETNLLGISQSMFRDKTIVNNTMSFYYLDIYHAVENSIDKRPYGFPFALYLAHVLTGYRWQNSFIVNGLFTFATLALLFLNFRSRKNWQTATAACILCLAQPLFVLSATSGGFELIACFWQIASYVSLLAFDKSPTPTRFFVMLASWLMFINTRYESIAVVAILGVGMLLFHAPFRKQLWHYLWTVPWAFVSIMPVIWLIVTKGDDQQAPAGTAIWGLSYIKDHIREMGTSFLEFEFYYPFSPVITLAVIGLIGYAAPAYLEWFKGRRTAEAMEKSLGWLLVIASLVGQTAVYLIYYAGGSLYTSSTRYYVPFCVALALIAVTLASQSGFRPKHILTFAALKFALYMPVTIQNRYLRTLELPRQTKEVYRFLADKPKHETLVIVDRPGQYTVQDFSAMSYPNINTGNYDLFNNIKQHTFSKVYAIQEVSVDTQIVDKDFLLSDRFSMTPVYEIRTTATKFMRISEVGIKNNAL